MPEMKYIFPAELIVLVRTTSRVGKNASEEYEEVELDD